MSSSLMENTMEELLVELAKVRKVIADYEEKRV